jgi:hypothetical protein
MFEQGMNPVQAAIGPPRTPSHSAGTRASRCLARSRMYRSSAGRVVGEPHGPLLVALARDDSLPVRAGLMIQRSSSHRAASYWRGRKRGLDRRPCSHGATPCPIRAEAGRASGPRCRQRAVRGRSARPVAFSARNTRMARICSTTAESGLCRSRAAPHGCRLLIAELLHFRSPALPACTAASYRLRRSPSETPSSPPGPGSIPNSWS